MLRMVFQSGIENLPHLHVPCQKFCDTAAVAVVLQHADGERLGSTQHKPAFKWRQNRACGFLNEPQLLGLLLAGANDDSAESVAMPVEKFRCRMNDHVRAQRNWLLKKGRHESVVHD